MIFGAKPYGNIVTNGLVLNLDATNPASYPGTGTTWFDMSGNKNHGTLTNGPTFVQERGKGSIVFDGVNDYVVTNDSPSLRMSSNMTLGAWFKIPQYELPYRQCLIGKNYTEYELGVYPLGGIHTYTGRPTCNNYDEGITAYNTAGRWYSDIWYNLYWTLENAFEICYFNGVQIGTYTKTNAGTCSTATNNLYIGSRTANDLWFKGNISVVQVYNKTLTAQEVLQNYNALKSRFV